MRPSADCSTCAKQLKDLKVRADSWQSTPISGQPAASYVADFVGTDGRPMAIIRRLRVRQNDGREHDRELSA